MKNARWSNAARRFPPRVGWGLAILLALAGCGNGGMPVPESASRPAGAQPATKTAAVHAPPAIDVLSEPAGASIFLNGRLIGATPLQLPDLPHGAYCLRLERQGFAPRSLALHVKGEAQVIKEELRPQPTGALHVKVEPQGAEVLLNGELVGVTPLELDGVPVGIHEITIRKTNFRPYTSIVRIEAGGTARFADKDKEHRLLKDLILEMLDGLTRSEPHRATHFLDKGHYLFINGRMDEAAEAFLDAEEVCARPPVLPAEMTEGEREAEMRLYSEDRKRVSREVARHRGIRSFDFATAQQFNAAYERAQQRRLLAKVGSWEWVEDKGRALQAEGQYLQAVQLYQSHLDRVGEGPTAFPCRVDLMKVHLLLRDLSGFRAVFEKLAATTQDPRKLLDAIRSTLPYHDRLRSSQRPEFLNALGAPLIALNGRTDGPERGDCAAELGRLYTQQGRHAEAIPFLEMAVAHAGTDQEKEERSLQCAEALRLAKRLDEAKKLYTRLAESERETVRRRALAGLSLLGVTRP